MRPEALTRPQLRYAAAAACVAVILVVSGYAVTTHYSHRIFLLVGVMAMVALAVAEPGVFMGVLVLAALNGLPFLDTSHPLVHHIAIQDAACLALIAVVAGRTIGAGRAAWVSGLANVVSWCGLALFLWCAFIVVRTSVDGNVPLLGAIRFGRDFLYFGALLIFLPQLRIPPRQVERLLGVLIVGVCMFSVGQIVTVLGVGNVHWLVHTNASGRTLGLTRVYSPMNDLLSAGVAGGIAVLALARGRAQAWAIPVTLLLSTSLVIQLTRARWIGLIGGLVVVSLWLAVRAERRVATMLRRRLAFLGMGLISGVAMAAVAAPSAVTGGPLATRFLSIFTDVGSANVRTSTIAVREHVASLMAGLLGSHWLLGLGLIPPAVHYFLALPNGALRDPDVGALNAIITIGVIGAVLIYLPVVVVLVGGLRRRRASGGTRSAWIPYGGAIFIVTTLISSVTLGTLFSVGGLVLTAVVLSLVCQAVESPGVAVAEAGVETTASDLLAPSFELAGVAVEGGATFGARDAVGPPAPVDRRALDLDFDWEDSDQLVGFRTREPIDRDRAPVASGDLVADGQPPAWGAQRPPTTWIPPQRPAAGARLLTLLTVGGVLLAGVIGFLLAGAVVATAPSTPPLQQRASAGPLSAAYPQGWRAQAPPASPALGLSDEVALAPPSPGRGLLVIGRETAPDSSQLPTSLHRAIAGLGPAQLTVLGGFRVYRYLDQSVSGLTGPATLYAIPTTAGTILGVCEKQGSAPTFASTCEQIVATARLGLSTPAPVSPSAGYDTALTAAMGRLNAARSQADKALARARTPQAQAAAASALATAHLRAAAAVDKLSAGPAQAANLSLAGALRAGGNAYRALAQAAAHHDAQAYAAARSAVSGAMTRLSAAVLALGKFGSAAG